MNLFLLFFLGIAAAVNNGYPHPAPRVFNGTDVKEHTFPWHVDLYYGIFFCGASLIGERWVLTAAHCVDSKKNDSFGLWATLEFGSIRLHESLFSMYINQSNVYMHQGYDNELNHDIALIRLPEKAHLSNKVKPILLQTEEELESNSIWVTGYGATKSEKHSNVLQLGKSQVDKTGAECELSRTTKMICVSVNKSDSLMGHGDSGSAVFTNVNGRVRQIGIVSYGFNWTALIPVSEHIHWILTTIASV